METKIYVGNSYRNVDVNKAPESSKMLDSFLLYNNAPRCFLKTNSKWYKLDKNGTTHFVSRTLDLPLKTWLKIALDDNYTGIC